MLRFSLLGSGSSGNAIFVASNHAKILIDNGLSYKQLQRRSAAISESLDGLDAVFVTHEHGDHVNGVGVLARKMDVPVYMTHATYAHLPRTVGRIPRVSCFDAGDAISVGGMSIASFSISHDAADPVSFTVTAGGCRLGIATDLGQTSHLVRERLKGSQALILESNYCPEMLRHSSYPAAIRQRISGSRGHLSNEAMNSLLSELVHPELQWVIAVHVSQENNTEARARARAARVLRDHPQTQLVIAQQDAPTPLFAIGNGTRQVA